MIYGYARVSTVGQGKDGNGLEAQKEQLKLHGAEKIYFDSFTGTKLDRPQFSELLKNLQPNDTLMVTKLDRIARSASQGNELITELIKRDIKVHILNIGVLDNTSTSKLIRGIFFAFAEFERDMIVERTQEGKAIARLKEGYKEGRPKKYSQTKLDRAIDLLETQSYNEVAEFTGISKSTLIREVRRRKEEEIMQKCKEA